MKNGLRRMNDVQSIVGKIDEFEDFRIEII